MLLSAIVAVLAAAAAQASPLVSQQSEAELSGGTDGKATVTLSVDGKGFNSPFTWSVAVQSAAGSILLVSRDDAWLDRFFADDGYMQECAGYEQCKRSWYFERLPAAVKGAIRRHDPSQDPVAPWKLEMLPELAAPFLTKKGLDPVRRHAVITEMLALAQQGFTSITLPYSPLQDESWMYVPSLGYFVPWWED